MSLKSYLSNALSSTKLQLTALATTIALGSSSAMADTDNGGTTLTVPTFITGDETTTGWFDLLGNTILHYVNEYIMPLLLVGFGIGWLFFFLFMGNRRAKASVSN